MMCVFPHKSTSENKNTLFEAIAQIYDRFYTYRTAPERSLVCEAIPLSGDIFSIRNACVEKVFRTTVDFLTSSSRQKKSRIIIHHPTVVCGPSTEDNNRVASAKKCNNEKGAGFLKHVIYVHQSCRKHINLCQIIFKFIT